MNRNGNTKTTAIPDESSFELISQNNLLVDTTKESNKVQLKLLIQKQKNKALQSKGHF
jgi:hypothetical protein